MKTLLVTAVALGIASSICLGDIHDPPSNDHGPTRKLSRGLANVFNLGVEIPHNIAQVNEREGNAAALSYGVVRGIGRSAVRFGVGIYEVLFWPIPMYRDNYMPVLQSDTHWPNGGYSEFPPELGNETKYPYVRKY